MAQRIEELDNGVAVCQVTDDPAEKNNIYCEGHFCTADSSAFVYQQFVADDGRVARDFIVCEFGTWDRQVAARGRAMPRAAVHDAIYFVRSAGGDEHELVRLDIVSGESRVVPVDGGVSPLTGMTVSHDERRLCDHRHPRDRQHGSWTSCGPRPQAHRSGGVRLLEVFPRAHPPVRREHGAARLGLGRVSCDH